jgi:hypothetical protein
MTLFRFGLGAVAGFFKHGYPREHGESHAGAVGRALQLALFRLGQEDAHDLLAFLDYHLNTL